MKAILILLACFSLTACGTYHSGFDCKAEPGVGCKSISEINGMINKGSFTNKKNKRSEVEVVKQNTLPFPQVIPNDLHNSEVYRQPELVMRIWLAPYIDKTGAYQEAQYTHEVIETGKWLEFRDK